MNWRVHENKPEFIAAFEDFSGVAESCLRALHEKHADAFAGAIPDLVDRITRRIKLYLDDMEVSNSSNLADSPDRASVLRELRAIADGFRPGHRVKDASAISTATLDTILDTSRRSYSVISFEEDIDDQSLGDLLRDVTLLDHDSRFAVHGLKRMSNASEDRVPHPIGKRRIFPRVIFSEKLHQRIARLRQREQISFSKLRRRLSPDDQNSIVCAAESAWLRLRLSWQNFGTAQGHSTLFSFEQRNPHYNLARDVLNLAWNADWGKPRFRGPSDPNGESDLERLHCLLDEVFDCIDEAIAAMPADVASRLRETARNRNHARSTVDIIEGRRTKLILHVLLNSSYSIILRSYRVWFHAFIEVSPIFCNDEGSRADRRLVLSRVFGPLVAWSQEIDACIATGDDRPRERRVGPAGRPASKRRKFPRQALKAETQMITVPFFGRGVVPEPEVLEALVDACCDSDPTVLAAWRRVRALVPADFLVLVPEMVAA